jgi:hypothetical protein
MSDRSSVPNSDPCCTRGGRDLLPPVFLLAHTNRFLLRSPLCETARTGLCKTRTSPSCSPARATCPDFQNCSFAQIFHQHRSNLADRAFFWNRVAGREALSHNSSATLKHRRYPWGRVAGGVSGVGGIGAWPPSTVRNKSIVPSGWGRAKSSP